MPNVKRTAQSAHPTSAEVAIGCLHDVLYSRLSTGRSTRSERARHRQDWLQPSHRHRIAQVRYELVGLLLCAHHHLKVRMHEEAALRVRVAVPQYCRKRMVALPKASPRWVCLDAWSILYQHMKTQVSAHFSDTPLD